jgi:tRNA A37 threonylcarbamoyladenosine synthetase subunit TsaC/SUA5/YrdC
MDTKLCAIKSLVASRSAAQSDRKSLTLFEKRKHLLDDNFFVLLKNNRYGFESALVAEAIKEYIEH